MGTVPGIGAGTGIGYGNSGNSGVVFGPYGPLPGQGSLPTFSTVGLPGGGSATAMGGAVGGGGVVNAGAGSSTSGIPGLTGISPFDPNVTGGAPFAWGSAYGGDVGVPEMFARSTGDGSFGVGSFNTMNAIDGGTGAGFWTSGGVGSGPGGYVPGSFGTSSSFFGGGTNANIPNFGSVPGGNVNNAYNFNIPNLGPIGGGLDSSGKTLKDLQKLYGKGIGTDLYNFIASGAGYNPQQVQALVAQLGPAVARGDAQIRDSFGDEGARFSSAAGIGLSDFYSQVQLGINQTVSGLYNDAVNRYIGVLTGFKGDALNQQKESQIDWGSIAQTAATIALGFI